MRVSIIGAGNTGLALAVHLLSRGHEPLVYTRSEEKARRLSGDHGSSPRNALTQDSQTRHSPARHGLTVTGRHAGTYAVPATTDLSTVARHGEVIVVCTWANAHREIFDRLYAAADGHPLRVLVFNGNWGAIEAFSALKEAGVAQPTDTAQPSADIVESSGMPYVAQLDLDRMTLHIEAVKTTITVASVLPEVSTPIRQLLSDLYEHVEYAQSVFETSLSAPNPIIHAPMCLLNMTKIEQNRPFHMLTDGFSERAEQLIAHIDQERHSLADALTVPYLPIVRQLNGFWGSDYPTLTELFRSNPVYHDVPGPDSVMHRFIQEDIPYGIAPLVSLGRLLDVPTPTCEALLTIYSDYFGRTFTGPVFTRKLIETITDSQ